MSLEVDVEQLRRVTFTEMAVFRRCPREYFERFRRDQGRRNSDRSGTRLFAGLAIHVALATWFRGRCQGQTKTCDIRAAFEAAWERYPFPKDPETAALRQRAIEGVVKYVERHGTASLPLMIEKTIKGRLGKTLLVGKVDRVDRTDRGGCEIIDYKIEDYRSEASGELELQRDFYTVAFEGDCGFLPERITFSFVTSGENISFECERDMAERAKLNIERLLTQMKRATSFEPRPNPFCPECGVSPSRCQYAKPSNRGE